MVCDSSTCNVSIWGVLEITHSGLPFVVTEVVINGVWVVVYILPDRAVHEACLIASAADTLKHKRDLHLFLHNGSYEVNVAVMK